MHTFISYKQTHTCKVLLCCHPSLQSIIFYAVRSPRLDEWLSSPTILEALQPMLDKNFIDLDPVFNMNIDEDYDFRASGITRNSFCNVYMDWIQYCATKRSKVNETAHISMSWELTPLLKNLGSYSCAWEIPCFLQIWRFVVSKPLH